MRKMIAVFTALCMLLCAGAAHAEFAAEDLLADYEEALRVLEECHPAFPVILQRHPDYADLCEAGRNRLREGRGHSAGELNTVLKTLFGQLGNPGHLSMMEPGLYQDYVRWIGQGMIPEDSREYRLVTDEQTRKTYDAMVGFSAAAEDSGDRQLPLVSYDPNRALLRIRFSSFASGLMERDRDVVTEAVRAHPEVRHIVFDICGNRGGADAYWAENIVAPFGESVNWERRIFFGDNELSRESGWMEDAVPFSMVESGSVPAFVTELGLTHMLALSGRIDPPEDGDRILRTDAKRWVLTDETTFSSADAFAAFCKQTGWATLVGRRTMGDGDGMGPCLVRLPKTGLLMRFSAETAANSDGSMNMLYGTIPDHPVKPKDQIFQAFLRLLDSLPE